MFKIEEFNERGKSGRHLYETEKSFNRYWKHHKAWIKLWNNYGDGKPPTHGLIGYRNGVIVRKYGVFVKKGVI